MARPEAVTIKRQWIRFWGVLVVDRTFSACVSGLPVIRKA